MVDKKIIKEWLNKAEEDMGFAIRNLADKDNTFYAQISFHFQQAADLLRSDPDFPTLIKRW